MKVAIVGTGIMGTGMADHFLKAGHEVFVWNRSDEKLQNLLEKGAIKTTTPKEAVEKAELVFEVTANDDSSRAVWLGDDGILAGADSATTLVASSTLSAEWVDEIVALCGEKNIDFFDMPLTGGRKGAESGNLTLLVGGDKEKLELLRPTLDAISTKVFYFGKAGSGMRYKLLLNMLQGIHIEGLGEVLRIAQENGMDVQAVGDALAERPGGTTTNLTWRDYQVDPEPINFSINWITKDLRYAKRFAKDIPTPLLDGALEKYEEAIDKGMGDDDWTAITKF